MEEWFVVVDGKPTGPFAFERLKNLNIKSDTFIKSSSMDDYKEAHEIPQIRDLLGIKHRVTAPQYFATLDIRLLAVVIDYLLVTGVCILIAVVVTSFADSQLLRLILSAAMGLAIPLVKYVYAILMECSKKQGTFGKYWLGIKVCTEQGIRLGGGQAVIRNLAKLVSVVTLGFGFLSGFFSKKQQCLHDIIAGTLVIKDRLV